MLKFAFVSFFITFHALAWPIKEQVLFIENDPSRKNPHQKWIKLGGNQRESISILLEVLKKSPSAKKIIDQAEVKAAKMGKNLVDVIIPGEHSITDTTLIRHFSVSDPLSVTYETKSLVYLNSDHNVEDGLLDLAHELVHFVHKEAFNPYGDHFDFKDFLRSTLEGRGGEIQAYLHECSVMAEIMNSRFQKDENCGRVYFPTNHQRSMDSGKSAFYQLGEFKDIFLEEIQQFQLSSKSFPYISSKEASFISSAYGLPYPLASLREFKQIMSKVCKNDQERYKYLGRSPSSMNQRLREDLAKRCSPFLAHHGHEH